LTGNQLVHRDVFASTIDKVVPASNVVDGAKMTGDAFGLKGSYDLFPENSGDYDVRKLFDKSCIVLVFHLPR